MTLLLAYAFATPTRSLPLHGFHGSLDGYFFALKKTDGNTNKPALLLQRGIP
jgi:hypothetical protein